jgi:hypothetical protein
LRRWKKREEESTDFDPSRIIIVDLSEFEDNSIQMAKDHDLRDTLAFLYELKFSGEHHFTRGLFNGVEWVTDDILAPAYDVKICNPAASEELEEFVDYMTNILYCFVLEQLTLQGIQHDLRCFLYYLDHTAAGNFFLELQ